MHEKRLQFISFLNFSNMLGFFNKSIVYLGAYFFEKIEVTKKISGFLFVKPQIHEYWNMNISIFQEYIIMAPSTY